MVITLATFRSCEVGKYFDIRTSAISALYAHKKFQIVHLAMSGFVRSAAGPFVYFLARRGTRGAASLLEMMSLVPTAFTSSKWTKAATISS
jgi:hypothetical protein